MIKSIILWVRQSVEGDDNKPSHRKLTTFTMVIMAAFMVFANKIQTQIHLYAFYAILTMIGILIGVVTIADILKFFGRGGADKDEKTNTASNDFKFTPPPPPIKEGDEIKATITDIKPS